MAPNLRHVTLLSDSLTDISALVRTKVAPVQQLQPDASYWDWQADVPAAPAADDAVEDLFSAEHLQANLIQAARETSSSTTTVSPSVLVAAHDAYWAEASDNLPAISQPKRVALHTQEEVEESAAYWAEANHAAVPSDAYWVEAGSSTASVPPGYWDEANHAHSCADAYWCDTHTTCSSSSNYWMERAHTRTAADRYWSMSVW